MNARAGTAFFGRSGGRRRRVSDNLLARFLRVLRPGRRTDTESISRNNFPGSRRTVIEIRN